MKAACPPPPPPPPRCSLSVILEEKVKEVAARKRSLPPQHPSCRLLRHHSAALTKAAIDNKSCRHAPASCWVGEQQLDFLRGEEEEGGHREDHSLLQTPAPSCPLNSDRSTMAG
eukprot:GHVS01013485.1.p2 GENE.GHVS01013485.1~~GHVS01013485.1.p2  ORF type:complete len:114 (-),score=40.29 GHVS01013485.1:430-771(-)